MKRKKLIPALMALAVLSGCGDSISENTGEPAATLQEQQTVSKKQTESTPDEPEVTRQTTTSAPAEPEPETTTTKKKAKKKKTQKTKADKNAPGDVHFMVNTSSDSTTLTWDGVEGAEGYSVSVKKGKNADWEELAVTEDTQCTVDVGFNKKYSFSVRAFVTRDGKKAYSAVNELKFPYLYQKDGITYVDGMMIVNKTYPLPADYGCGLTEDTEQAFYELSQGAANDGISLWITSGFRSYDEQNWTYWGYVERDGSTESADRYSARAGHSEHQSGYAMDLNFAGMAFNGTPEAQWIEKNCFKYGFILRYPEGKEDKTGYNYESWHIRYVGLDRAKRLHDSGLTVEEFYGLTSEYSD